MGKGTKQVLANKFRHVDSPNMHIQIYTVQEYRNTGIQEYRNRHGHGNRNRNRNKSRYLWSFLGERKWVGSKSSCGCVCVCRKEEAGGNGKRKWFYF